MLVFVTLLGSSRLRTPAARGRFTTGASSFSAASLALFRLASSALRVTRCVQAYPGDFPKSQWTCSARTLC